ncbi:MAG: helix-turn-helix domain-containing protein [Lachnospiraceae bacterium]|nr:helix-turn-helix domain-containing protein [Lachnospiraceae bacterium]
MEENTKAAELMNEIRIYNLQDLAPVLGVSYRTLLRYVKAGQLPAIKIGGRWKITHEQLMNFLNQR